MIAVQALIESIKPDVACPEHCKERLEDLRDTCKRASEGSLPKDLIARAGRHQHMVDMMSIALEADRHNMDMKLVDRLRNVTIARVQIAASRDAFFVARAPSSLRKILGSLSSRAQSGFASKIGRKMKEGLLPKGTCKGYHASVTATHEVPGRRIKRRYDQWRYDQLGYTGVLYQRASRRTESHPLQELAEFQGFCPRASSATNAAKPGARIGARDLAGYLGKSCNEREGHRDRTSFALVGIWWQARPACFCATRCGPCAESRVHVAHTQAGTCRPSDSTRIEARCALVEVCSFADGESDGASCQVLLGAQTS